MTGLNRIYSRQELWTLFLISSLPLHLWTLFLSFRDITWLTERTNTWDAIGVVSYGLVFALLESIILFIIFALLGFLILPHWNGVLRITLLSISELVLAFLAGVNQIYFIWGISVIDWLGHYAANLDHPLRFLYSVTLAIILLIVIPPVFLIFKSEKFLNSIYDFLKRLEVLAGLYLILDIAALLIIMFRSL